ncbi:MAG: hypothetical protein ACPGC5_02350 [Flavobacteriaceae bacterium]
MYLSESEEIVALIVAALIVMGFVIQTYQEIKTTVAEEKAKHAQKKADEEKVKQLIEYLDTKNELIQTVLRTQKKIDQEK